MWGLGGFLAGVAVWHAIGFWAFLAYLVGGGQHPRTSLLADIVLSKSRDQIAPSAVAGSQPRTTTISGRGEAFSPSAGSAQIVFASHERCTTLSLQRSDGAVKPQACDPGVGSVVPRIAAVRGDLQVARTDWTASVAAPEWAAEVDATADRAPAGGQRTATPRIAEPSGAPRAAGAWSPVVQSQRPSSITTGSLD